PTLTTMRLAERSHSAASLGVWLTGAWLMASKEIGSVAGAVGRESRVDLDRPCGLQPQRLDVLEGLLHQALAALARESRDLEHRALVTQAPHDVLDARFALLGRQHVDLVQHQPAWLVVQR